MPYARARPLRRRPEDVRAEAGLCDHPDCLRLGEFRAPRGRTRNDGAFWFCLDHVREYNKAWDFFAGMSREDIERFQREVATWHRPTWPLGTNPYARSNHEPVDDPFDILRAGRNGTRHDSGQNGNGGLAAPIVSPDQRRALETLELDLMANLLQIKTRYKQLVKRYHPDANGSNPASEERLREIIRAYDVLMSCGYS